MARKQKKDKTSLVNKKAELVELQSFGMTRDMATTIYASYLDFRKWTPFQNKIFSYALSRIDWAKPGNNNAIRIDHQDFLNALGWDYSKENIRNVSSMLKNEISYMMDYDTITIQDPYTGCWAKGDLLSYCSGGPDATTLEISQKFMPHFENLYLIARETDKNLVMKPQPFKLFMATDIETFGSSFSTGLYLLLISKYNTNCKVNKITFTIDELKKFMAIREDSYIKPNGKINFNGFEERALAPAVESLAKSEMLTLLKFKDTGLYYQKEKDGRVVKGYTFKYVVNDINSIKRRRQKLENNSTSSGGEQA